MPSLQLQRVEVITKKTYSFSHVLLLLPPENVETRGNGSKAGVTISRTQRAKKKK